MSKIEKELGGNLRKLLSKEIRAKYKSYPYIEDVDEKSGEVFFNIWSEGVGDKTYKETFTFDGDTKVTLGGQATEVIELTTYKEISEKVSTVEKMLSSLVSHFGGTNRESEVIKQFDEEQMIAVEKLYIHPDDVDGIGDTISQEDTDYMVESLNKAIEEGRLQSGLFHGHKTEAFSPVRAWVAENDCTIGETDIRKGQPLVEIQFHNEKAWELRKDSTLAGISIGARAKEIEEINE